MSEPVWVWGAGRCVPTAGAALRVQREPGCGTTTPTSPVTSYFHGTFGGWKWLAILLHFTFRYIKPSKAFPPQLHYVHIIRVFNGNRLVPLNNTLFGVY